MPDRLLYLLHFDRDISGARHYLGITKEGRLGARLAEHQAGHGAALVRAALKAGASIRVARIYHGASFEEETARKSAGHFKRLCPICRGLPPAPECSAYPTIKAPPAADDTCQTAIANW